MNGWEWIQLNKFAPKIVHKLNRQAKLKSDRLDDREWHDMGAITFVCAAEMFAAILDDPIRELVFPLIIQVRDSEQPNIVQEFTVEKRVSYVVDDPMQKRPE